MRNSYYFLLLEWRRFFGGYRGYYCNCASVTLFVWLWLRWEVPCTFGRTRASESWLNVDRTCEPCCVFGRYFSEASTKGRTTRVSDCKTPLVKLIIWLRGENEGVWQLELLVNTKSRTPNPFQTKPTQDVRMYAQNTFWISAWKCDFIEIEYLIIWTEIRLMSVSDRTWRGFRRWRRYSHPFHFPSSNPFFRAIKPIPILYIFRIKLFIKPAL